MANPLEKKRTTPEAMAAQQTAAAAPQGIKGQAVSDVAPVKQPTVNPQQQQSVNAQLADDIASGKVSGSGVTNAYGKMAANTMDKLNAMGNFSYDFNKDPLFKTLSNSYMAQAQKAAANASAMAAARTGGYGNSYGAVAAGQQYNDALSRLYDQVPALQEAAYQRYLNERNDLYKQAGYYNDLGNTAADRSWRESEANREQGNWQKQFDQNVRQSDIDNAFRQSQFDYNKSQDAIDNAYRQAQADQSQKNWEAQFQYGQKQDAIDNAYRQAQADLAQKNWQSEFDYGRSQDAIDNAYRQAQADQSQQNWQSEFDYGKQQDLLSQMNRDREFNYNAQMDDYNNRLQLANMLAGMGNYGALEDLSGYDMSDARNADALNRAITIVKAAGLEGAEAQAFLRQYLGIGGLNQIITPTGGGKKSGGGKRKGGGSTKATYTTAPVTKQTTTTQTPKKVSEQEVSKDEWRRWFG